MTDCICLSDSDEDEVQLVATIVNIDCPSPKYKVNEQQTLSPNKQPTLLPTRQPTLPHDEQLAPRQNKQPPLSPIRQPTLLHNEQPAPPPNKQPPLLPSRQPTLSHNEQPASRPNKQPPLPPSRESTPPPYKQPPLPVNAQPLSPSTKQPFSPSNEQPHSPRNEQPTIPLPEHNEHSNPTSPKSRFNKQPTPPPADPINLEARMVQLKELGNEKFRTNQFTQAISIYKEAYAIATQLGNNDMSAILHFNLAQGYSRLGSYNMAVDECAKATKIKEDYLKAHLKRAEIYMIQKRFDEAATCYEHVCEIDPKNQRDYSILLKAAQDKAFKNHKKDHYQQLGLQSNCSQEELKRAYRVVALKHHPDRHSDTDILSRKIQEKKFKSASEAYKVLSDPRERIKYDQINWSSTKKSDMYFFFNRYYPR